MASNDKLNLSEGGILSKSEAAKMKPEMEKARQEFVNTPNPLVKPSLSDTQCRDNLIAVALRVLIEKQVAEWKINHDMAGVLAVRYANSAMVARDAERVPLNVAVNKGTATVTAPIELPPPVTSEEKPKSISEIIGEPEPVQEVK